MDTKEIRVLSLFSGIGGFEQGMIQSGYPYTVVGYSEWDKYASEIYNRNLGDTIAKGAINYGDATTINTSELPDFDLLIGGFPCQPFSVAGLQRGVADTRGTLFYDIARILTDKRPRYFLLENVKGLLGHDSGKTFQKILETITECGYVVQWQVVNSKHFGVPQNRERIYIFGYQVVGHTRGQRRPQVFPLTKGYGQNSLEINILAHNDKYRRTSQVFDPSGATEAIDTCGGGGHEPCIPVCGTPELERLLEHPEEEEIGPRAVLTPDRKEKRQNGRRVKDVEEPSFTLTGQDLHGVAVPVQLRKSNNFTKGQSRFLGENDPVPTLSSSDYKSPNGVAIQIRSKQGGFKKDQNTASTISGGAHSGGNHSDMDLIGITNIGDESEAPYMVRRLTPIECERLQGFPDNWTEGISNTQRYKSLGNAVTVNVTEVIAEAIYEEIMKEED